MRRWIIGLGLVGALLVERSAAADSPKAGELWLGGDLLVGYLAGPYHYEGPAAPGYGVTGTIEFDPDVSGSVLGLTGVLGMAPGAGWALGAAGSLDLTNVSHGYLSGTHLDFGYRASAMLAAAFWPHPAWQLRASAGIMRVAFTYSTDEFGSADNIVDPEPLVGPAGQVLAAWVPNGVGGALRVGYAHLDGERSSWAPFEVMGGVLVTTP